MRDDAVLRRALPLGRGLGRILVYFELKNRIWRQLFRLFISAEKVEMVHLDAFWNLGVPSNWKPPKKYQTLEWTAMEPWL